jgi:hypothetical protein
MQVAATNKQYVYCSMCGANGPTCDGAHAAVKAWNDRVKPKPRPIAEAILDRLAAHFKWALANYLKSDKVPFKAEEMKAFLDEREQGDGQ